MRSSMRGVVVRVCLFIMGCGGLFATKTWAKSSFAEDQVILRFSHTVTLEQAQQLLDSEKYEVARVLVPSMNLFLVKLKSRLKAEQAVHALSQKKGVLYVQLDFKVTEREMLPDDPLFKDQWGLRITQASDAWDIGTGGKDGDGNDLVVAVIDSGMDLKHKDLSDNLWVNAEEIPANEVDDDGNGFVDDVSGWNAYKRNGKIPNSAHGTHVAGIIGATGNNKLLASGVNWNVKIMAIAASSDKTSIVAEGYGYAIAQKKLWLESAGKKGANIVATNSSFGVNYGNCDSEDFRVWRDLYDEMGKYGIVSAGATANLNINVDEKGDVPTGCKSDFLIKVTNTDKSDKRNRGAAFGKLNVELGAPGTDVLSTLPGDKSGLMSGTSMATPHVAAAVALLYSVGNDDFQVMVRENPAAAAKAVKQVILSSVDPNESLKGITVCEGRLNLAKAVQAMGNFRR